MSEDKNFQAALDKASQLETIDFTKSDNFNIQEYYTALEKIASKNESAKNEEAELIVEKDAKDMIDSDFIESLKTKRKSVEDYIRKYDPNKEETKKLEILDVDKIYAISNYLLNSYIQYVNEMRFHFILTKLEYKFLNKVLMSELEYNGDEVFNFAELYQNFWKGVQEKVDEDKMSESHTVTVDIKMILILHHLIKNHTVKGKTHDFNHFQGILFKIAKINKLFNAYNIIIERIKSDRELWGGAMDEIMKLKDPEYMNQVAQMAKEASEKKLGMPGFDNPKIHEISDADLGK